jgi:hypothetical protein
MEVEEVIALAQEQIDREAASDPDVKKMIKIVREFIETHRVMCYGGTAINNLLPPEDQFYDFSIEIPDYDFFSETPQAHAAKLADRLANAGFASVEVKPGVHLGTFKVFANYIGVADVSHLEVRHATPSTPSSLSRLRISPAALTVNDSASTFSAL